MKILYGEKIKKALIQCKPERIAVAYIGSDWKKFIPETDNLNQVILSPTVGSNPHAIYDLVKTIGWDKIFFLNELHAKIYIGSNSAITGSANLTSNGLNGDRLAEVCIKLSSDKSLSKINNIFDDMKIIATEQYPTEEKKIEAARSLEIKWNQGISSGIISPPSEVRLLKDFDTSLENIFYVSWYQPLDIEYSEELKKIKHLIDDDILFHKNDNIQKNLWVLMWRITNHDQPDRRCNLNWLYIHEYFIDGVITGNNEEEYTTCAIQRKDLDAPYPPFELTKEVQDAFFETIIEKDVAEFMIQTKNKIFDVEYSLNGLPELITRMKEKITL